MQTSGTIGNPEKLALALPDTYQKGSNTTSSWNINLVPPTVQTHYLGDLTIRDPIQLMMTSLYGQTTTIIAGRMGRQPIYGQAHVTVTCFTLCHSLPNEWLSGLSCAAADHQRVHAEGKTEAPVKNG